MMDKVLRSGTYLFALLSFFSFAMPSHAQSNRPSFVPPTAAEEVANALAKVRSGDFSSYHVQVLADARAVVAIPDLEKQFTLVSDEFDKAKIAQVLVYLGDKNDVYWNFLESLAKDALAKDAPDPDKYDAEGQQLPALSEEIVQWAKDHKRTVEGAVRYAAYEAPGVIGLIGMTDDVRALPLLRRALSSRNPNVQIAAAEGIARLHDATSLPRVIELCKASRRNVASMIAQSLVYFDEPDAQRAVDTYLPKDVAKELRARRMAGGRP